VVDRRIREQREELVFSPLGIVSRNLSGKITRYEYDPRYDVIHAILDPDEEVRLEFHPQRRLAVRKSIRDLLGDSTRVFEFEYSEDFERLMAIRDSDGPDSTFEHDSAGRVAMIRRGDDRIEWTRSRFGNIESGLLNGEAEWNMRVDAAASPRGFVIEGELDEEERRLLEDWLGLLRTATSRTYCPEIMPSH